MIVLLRCVVETGSGWVAIEAPADPLRRPGGVAVVRYYSVMDVLWFLCHHDIVGGGEDLEPVQLVH